MDKYINEINGILQELQQVTVVATYGNTKKISTVIERLIGMADAMKKEGSKEAALDE